MTGFHRHDKGARPVLAPPPHHPAPPPARRARRRRRRGRPSSAGMTPARPVRPKSPPWTGTAA